MANKQTLVTLKSKDFKNLFENGRRIYLSNWIVVNLNKRQILIENLNVEVQNCQSRFGWTLPKYVGNAVVRNRFKRWCREFLRAHPELLAKKIDANFVFRKREKDFYKSLKHEEFNKTLSLLVNKVG